MINVQRAKKKIASAVLVALLGGLSGGVMATTATIAHQSTESETIFNESIFGERLFRGNFNNNEYKGFNENYLINNNDAIQVSIWGAIEFNEILTVDEQGNILLPHIGPVHVAGVANGKLNSVVKKNVSKVFTKNIGIYTNLATSTPVQVYVTGYVNEPGLYSGASGDSILRFLDAAKGIDPQRGSYLDIQLIRNGKAIESYDLYDFLLNGQMPDRQLRGGDVIMVKPQKGTITQVKPDGSELKIEITKNVALSELLPLIKPEHETHVRLKRLDGNAQTTKYDKIDNAKAWTLKSNDVVELVTDVTYETINVRVEGEHDSRKEYVLKPNTTLGELFDSITLNSYSKPEHVLLYRKSVQKRQKEMLDTTLQSLETSVLTAKSGTLETAQLRKQESEMILNWIERAKKVVPHGQVVIGHDSKWREIALEPGDRVVIPRKTTLVSVHGEVMFPRAVAFEEGMTVTDYIERSGGFTNNSDSARIVVLNQDGRFNNVDLDSWLGDDYQVQQGDEVLVLPKVDMKNMQATKDITQIIYQLAVAASVVLAI